ncbi:SEC-C motif domain protein [Pseudopedobacter saltans DSM 12145]|uniref:SEC-C motif domain protein n=1 Tax=Pseudopedobacter saltans (strain ATCC 51119 / DSM 12145 / JCM 21818 / CCUG 39354 / LMG 10337 / NBRC 100064 / NCIMB 13643) TaxID=762903 RepID=F0S988_PSESL|nr:SEC-C metal-binding domain-containing protein [Pseudopedobacter saltans]ADY52438.1 SEC-C motif domain protein [Pseudopedobacter saltans DSM 12145]
MLNNTSLTLNRGFKIRNFEEDKIAILKSNPGLHFVIQNDGTYIFSGNYYLKNDEGKLIKSFNVKITPLKNYPNSVPIVYSTGDEIEKIDDYHISKEGIICFDHTYTLNKLASGGLRLYDFIEFYFPKYFSWVLLKQCEKAENLKEWAHQDNGTIQYFQEILRISDIDKICDFLDCYLKVSKPSRNEKCYCGSGIKLKNCHLDAVNILRATSKKELQNDYHKIKKVK